MLYNQFGIEYKPTTKNNSQANAILECLHGVLCNMHCAAGLKGKTVLMDKEQLIIDAAWVASF